LHKYTSVEEIIDEFCVIRRKTYQTRKDALIVDMRSVLVKLSNRARYILDVLSGVIDMRKKTNKQVDELLESMKYDRLDGDYKYLVKMPMDSVTEENVAHILKEKENTETELQILIATTIDQMWLKELDILEKEYGAYKIKREKLQIASTITPAKKGKK